jgi:hypothetical protein
LTLLADPQTPCCITSPATEPLTGSHALHLAGSLTRKRIASCQGRLTGDRGRTLRTLTALKRNPWHQVIVSCTNEQCGHKSSNKSFTLVSARRQHSKAQGRHYAQNSGTWDRQQRATFTRADSQLACMLHRGQEANVWRLVGNYNVPGCSG